MRFSSVRFGFVQVRFGSKVVRFGFCRALACRKLQDSNYKIPGELQVNAYTIPLCQLPDIANELCRSDPSHLSETLCSVCVSLCVYGTPYALESDAVRPLRTPRSPMDRACKAALMTLGEEELARHLLLQTLPRDVAVRKIIIQKLRYRDEDLCTIVSERCGSPFRCN